MKTRADKRTQVGQLKLTQGELEWLLFYPCDFASRSPKIREVPIKVQQWYSENMLAHIIAFYDVLDHEGFTQQPLPVGQGLN